VASRYIKQQNWDAAIEVLYGGALALLKAGQGASGGDLGGYLVEVYVRGGKGVGGEEKGLWDFCLFVVVVVVVVMVLEEGGGGGGGGCWVGGLGF
jgi:hypothetical protein